MENLESNEDSFDTTLGRYLNLSDSMMDELHYLHENHEDDANALCRYRSI